MECQAAGGHSLSISSPMCRVITVHNDPGRLKLPKSQFKHLKFELPDIEAADVSKFFNPTFELIEEARKEGTGE